MEQLTPENPAADLSHVDSAGRAHMVDVGSTAKTDRIAIAEGRVEMQAATAQHIRMDDLKKGNVLTTAQIAGIMAAKRTHELIPLCHPLTLTHVNVELTVEEPADLTDDTIAAVTIRATVHCHGATGVEMEALTAVNVAALTVYDMAKAIDRGMRITDLRLRHKSGGRSGTIDLP